MAPAGRGRFSDALLDEIRAKTDIVAVIGEYVQLKPRGSNYIGLCPFHQEKTPSFTVTPEKQMFYCFGCQTGGNVFTFLMKREGLSFTEVVEQLAARAGVSLPEKEDPRMDPRIRAAAERRKAELELLHKIADFASRYYHQLLLKHPEAENARAYLKRRGITPESVEVFRLGYSLESWTGLYRALKAKGVADEPIEKAGLILKGRAGYYDRFRGRLMFTIADQRGRAIGFGARALADGVEPKYLNSPETPLFSKGRAVYALHLATGEIRRRKAALVVEGYMDAIACHEHGFGHTVASMGTAFTSEQARALHRLTETVITAFDADAAGTQATLRGLQVLATGGFPVRVAAIPGGKDPDECLRSPGGPESFEKALNEAISLAEFGYALAARRHDTATIDGRAAAARELLPFLASVTEFSEQQAYVEEFARRLFIPPTLLRGQLDRYLRDRARQPGRDGGRGVRDSIESSRNNKENQGAGSSRAETGDQGQGDPEGRARSNRLLKQVLDAERALVALMVKSEEGLHLVLAALLEAAAWCREIGLEPPDEPDSSALEMAAAAEPLAGLDVDFDDEATEQDAGGRAVESETPPDDTEALTETEETVLDWFLGPVHRDIVKAVLAQARYGPVDAARLVDGLPAEEAEDVAGTLFELQSLSDEAEWAVRDCLGVLKEHRLNSRIEELHRRISDLERRGAQVEKEYAELLRELIDLERHTDGGTGHWRVPGD